MPATHFALLLLMVVTAAGLTVAIVVHIGAPGTGALVFVALLALVLRLALARPGRNDE